MTIARISPRAIRIVALLFLAVVVVVAMRRIEGRGDAAGDASSIPPTSPPQSATAARVDAPGTHDEALAPTALPLRKASPHLVIKTSPATISGYDGKTGTITFDHAGLMALNAGDYVVTQLGEHTVVHRVYEKQVREDHVYLPMDVVDPMTGEALGYHGAYHAYEGGTSYYFNSEHGGFEVLAEYGKPVKFVHFGIGPGGEQHGSNHAHEH
jgi:hypothetical protein